MDIAERLSPTSATRPTDRVSRTLAALSDEHRPLFVQAIKDERVTPSQIAETIRDFDLNLPGEEVTSSDIGKFRKSARKMEALNESR